MNTRGITLHHQPIFQYRVSITLIIVALFFSDEEGKDCKEELDADAEKLDDLFRAQHDRQGLRLLRDRD